MQSRVLSLDSSPRSGPWLLLSPSRYEIGRCARRFSPAVFFQQMDRGSAYHLRTRPSTNNVLQQVVQRVHHDSDLHGAISEQQGQVIAEVNRLREELASLKKALRQGFILIDETCAKHSSALEGLQSFAGRNWGKPEDT